MKNPDKANDRPTVPQVLPLVRAVYQRHIAGCCLHVMMDDGNCGQYFADSAVELALERKHADCLDAARMLAQMTGTQRRKVYSTHRK